MRSLGCHSIYILPRTAGFSASPLLQEYCKRYVIFVIELNIFVNAKVTQPISFTITPCFFALDRTIGGNVSPDLLLAIRFSIIISLKDVSPNN